MTAGLNRLVEVDSWYPDCFDHRGPIYSFKGFDSAGYYTLSADPACADISARLPGGGIAGGDAPIFSQIAADPELGRLRLIAEPWDTGAYQLGRGFPGVNWLQWNGRFRDDIRRFVKGDPGMVPDLMRRSYGSDDLFPDNRADAYHAYQRVEENLLRVKAMKFSAGLSRCRVCVITGITNFSDWQPAVPNPP